MVVTWVSRGRTNKKARLDREVHTAGREYGVYEKWRAETASTGDHVLEKGVFVEERKEEIFVCEVGLEKSTHQLVIRRDKCPGRRLGRIDVGVNHLGSVEGRIVQGAIVADAGREVRRRRPVPFGVEALAVDERQRVRVAGGPEEVRDVEHAAQAVLMAPLGADGQLEEETARADLAHNGLDAGAGADAAQDLVHFRLRAVANQSVELLVHAARLFLRVQLALQRLAASLGGIRIVDTLSPAELAGLAGWPLGIAL